MIKQPESYLLHSRRILQSARREVDARAERLAEIWTEGQFPETGWKRLHQVTAAERKCLTTFEQLMKPVDTFLKRSDRGGGELVELSMRDPGWQTESLLPYLLRDWKCDRELRSVRNLFSAALDEQRIGRSGKTLLVLGCGGGALLHSLSPGFSRAIGLDLSLPILFAVRELFAGRPIQLSVPTASTSGFRIVDTVLQCRDAHSSRRPELMAGDACQTPFASRSIDCVITPFLLDVVHDPRQLAGEIHRILSDAGLWMNYGPSSSPDGIWYFDGPEFAQFLELAGFSATGTAYHRNTHLDRRQIDSFTSFESHICYLFAARKAGRPKWKRVASQQVEPLANLIPIHYRGARLVSRRALWEDPEPGGSLLTTFLEQPTVKGLARRFEISEMIARVLELVDGRRSVQEIVEKLIQDDSRIDYDDAIEAFRIFFDTGLLSVNRVST